MAFDRKAYMKKWNAEHREYKSAKQKEYYWDNPDKFKSRSSVYRKAHKDTISDYNHKYWVSHREEIRENRRSVMRAYRLSHQEEHRMSNAQQRIKHHDEVKARSMVNHAIRDGELVRKPCEICGEEKAQAHHDDYNYPLNVRWLCIKCHNEWHRNNKPIRVEKG